jgi:O-antigen ligase
MSTISSHEEDESASTRVAVWMWTLDYVKERPLGGGFDAYRSNSFTYRTRVTLDMGGGVTQTVMQDVTDEGRAYHSSYFEMLGEQGWPGLSLWLLIHALGLLQMEKLRRRYLSYRKRKKVEPRPEDEWKAGLANALQQAQIVYLVGSLFIGIAYQPFVLMVIGLQCGLWSYLQRVDSPAKRARKPFRPAGSADAVAAAGAALR